MIPRISTIGELAASAAKVTGSLSIHVGARPETVTNRPRSDTRKLSTRDDPVRMDSRSGVPLRPAHA